MTHNQTYNWRAFCKDSLDQIENYQQAEAEDFKGWCIHHRLEIQPDGTRVSAKELIDQGLYYGRPANELVFMRGPEHNRLHLIGNTYTKGKHHSADTRLKMSEAQKGKHKSTEHCHKIAEALRGENNPMYGKHHTEESRKKNSLAHIGKHHTEESRQKNSLSQRGRHWWNDGVSCKRAKECPGPEWKPGRILRP